MSEQHTYPALAAAARLIEARALLHAAGESLESIARQTQHPAVMKSLADLRVAKERLDGAFEPLKIWL